MHACTQYIAALDLAAETRVFWSEYDSASYSRIRMYSNTSGNVNGAVGTGALAVSHTNVAV
jgi:hypothetical protein